MKRVAAVLAIAWLFLINLPVQAAPLNVTLTPFARGFDKPHDIAHSGISGDTRLFVAEKHGRIKIVRGDGTLATTPFLDIEPRVGSAGGEEGLLGLAFHPDYARNGYFFVFYTDNNSDLVISRFTRSTGSSDLADPASERRVLRIRHPTHKNHNGGDLNFSPLNGYLYASVGDGGGGGDPANNAQNKDVLLGKILRLDINDDDFPAEANRNYRIPPSNPFVGKAGADEVWALGLRNPWRFSFDRANSNMFIGDVGQGTWEEIDYERPTNPGGYNYGWRCYEAESDYNLTGCGPRSNYRFPLTQYSLSGTPCAVTGGYVYRGAAYPSLTGHYTFADFCSGDFYTLYKDSTGWHKQFHTRFSGRNISTFGENGSGELFAGDLSNGTIYRVGVAP